VDFGWKSDRFDSGLTYLDIGERFNAEMGYIPRTDVRTTKASAAWTPRPRWAGVRQLRLGGTASYFENHAGRVESRNQGLEFTINRQDGAIVQVSLDRDYDYLPYDWQTAGAVIPIGGYSWSTVRASYSSDQSRRVYGSFGVDLGGYYGGDKQTYRASFDFLPLETLLVENSFTHNRITLAGADPYSTNVVSTRVSYSFSPDLFLKTYVQ